MKIFHSRKSIYGPALTLNEGGRYVTLWVAPWCPRLRFRLYVGGLVFAWGDRK